MTTYATDYVTNLEMQWGVGFLSPGGPTEVREILRDIDVQGKTVLDIGCGTGGPSIVIAQSFAPARVVGIDIEPQLIEKAKGNIAGADLGGIVELQLVEVGPLPFEDQSFDIVFSKDALIHIEDKSALYREVLRVLKPGGLFAASDWLRSADAEELAGYKEWRSLSPLNFSMQTADETLAEMIGAGLTDVTSRDRNKWYAQTAAQEVKIMESDEWRDRFIAAFGAEEYPLKLKMRLANAKAAESGGLRPTHLFGRRPD